MESFNVGKGIAILSINNSLFHIYNHGKFDYIMMLMFTHGIMQEADNGETARHFKNSDVIQATIRFYHPQPIIELW